MQAKCMSDLWWSIGTVILLPVSSHDCPILSTGTQRRPTTPYSSLRSSDAGPRTVTAGHCSCPSNRLTLRLNVTNVAAYSNASSRVQTLLYVGVCVVIGGQ